ncbi:hypothetical protein ACLKA7_000784 [Drosophila subpalustris]
MLAQAHLTFLKSQSEGICQALREEMRSGFMEIMKAINDIAHPQLPVFDEKATEEELLAFDEDARPGSGSQQGTKPKQTAEVEKSIEAGGPEVEPLAKSLSRRDNWRVENRRANDFSSEDSGRQDYDGGHPRSSWVRVEKWDVSFDGDYSKSSVEDFIFRVEFLQHQYQCPWCEVLRCFHILLKGRAREWGTQTEHDKMHELMQREQGRGESAVDFIHAIQKLASRLREPLPEARIIKIAKKGLRDDLARYVYALDVYTIDQLRDECSEVEKAFGRRNPRPAFDARPPPRFGAPRGGMSANEIDVPREDSEFPELEVEEARVVQRAQRRAGCWNCESADHEFCNCMAKERKIFCYRCGRPDTLCPQCPDCAGNWQRSATRAGESRPGINLSKIIFDERLLDGMRLVTRKMKKARDRFKTRRQIRRQVVAAVARSDRTDPRVFAEFSLGGRAHRVRRRSIDHRASQQIAYLGIDFWRIFGIAPDIVGPQVPVVAAIDERQGMAEQIAHYVEDDGVKSEPQAWELEKSQKVVFEEVKAKFLAFEKVGLGKTHAEKHRIELVAGAQPVKDRHYPLSSAMQQVVWDEVDKMLAIGVIGESNSP